MKKTSIRMPLMAAAQDFFGKKSAAVIDPPRRVAYNLYIEKIKCREAYDLETVFDYLRWRGDVPFDADPFGEVDALILAELAYVDLDGIVPPDGGQVPLSEVYQKYFSDRTEEDVLADKNVYPKSPLLLSGMLSGQRFSEMKLCFYESETDPEKDLQFSAVCFLPAGASPFVAFRGTDASITGWKEDFDLSYLPATGGQKKAAEYLDRVGVKLGVPFLVGGHSKGGNLAIYAAAFCDPSIRGAVDRVFSFDGPGFTAEIAESENYKAVTQKTVGFIPDTSLVGQLLTSKIEPAVVKSNAKGIAQHDGLTWEIERNRLERTELSPAGRVIGATFGEWIEQMDLETRRSFTDTVFALFESTGADTFTEMGGSILKSAEAILSSARKLPRERRTEVIRALAMLGHSGGAAATDYINWRKSKKQKQAE